MALSESSDHDPELASFLARVVDLAALGAGADPDLILEQSRELGAEFARLRRHRLERVLVERFEAFARQRFKLVDDDSEYAAATREVLCLSWALDEAPNFAWPALREAAVALSFVLAADGVPRLFGQVLRRVREIAAKTGNDDARAWLDAVRDSLPGD